MDGDYEPVASVPHLVTIGPLENLISETGHKKQKYLCAMPSQPLKKQKADSEKPAQIFPHKLKSISLYPKIAPPSDTSMRVIRFFTSCPRTQPQISYPFGVLPFRTSSSVSATSDMLLMNHATSTLFILLYFYPFIMC